MCQFYQISVKINLMPIKNNGKTNGKKTTKKIAEFKFNLDIKNLFIIIFIIIFSFYTLRSFSKEFNQLPTIEKSISTVVKDIKDDKVKKVEIIDNKMIVTYKNGTVNSSNKEPGESFMKTLKDAGVDPDKVNITVKDTQTGSAILNFIFSVLPVVLTVGLLYFLFRQAKGAQDSVFSFGK